MSFCSIKFGVFVLFFFLLYYLPIKKAAYQNLVLAASSFVFVYLLNQKMMIVYLATIALTFLGGILLEKCQSQKKRLLLLFLLIAGDLLVLLSLKYAKFFARIPVLSVFGMTAVKVMDHFSLFLPIGISFYTLSLVGYLVDVYRNETKADQNPLSFFVFAGFFPHILQGPIARYKGFTDQIRTYRSFSYDRMVNSLQLVLWGVMKKLIIADRAGIFVDNVYSASFTGTGTELLIASLLYTIQIYADFSGCVDIARGVSMLFGIDLLENFRAPYLSGSINEFWRRWHISLSSWFRDYIYIPLGGNRKGKLRRWINMIIVFLVSGFWHGVGLHYIAWGLIHGIYQVIGYFWTPIKNRCAKKLQPFGWNQRVFDTIVTFLLINFSWIMFRSESVKQALLRIRAIFTDQSFGTLFDGTMLNHGLSLPSLLVLLLFIALMVFVDVCTSRQIILRNRLQTTFLPLRWCLWICAILAVLVLGIYGVGYNSADFIYMKF